MQFPLVPPNLTSALATTRELRDFYQAKTLEYSQLLEQAQSQLTHAEALLTGLEQLQPKPIANNEANGKNSTNGNGFSNHQLAIELNGTKPEQTSASTVTVPNWEAELLPLYQNQNLPWAIGSLLQERNGTILKLDFIVRTLYGKLTAPQFEVISQQVFQILEHGVSEDRWHKDPHPHANNTDCYTWNLESLDNKLINDNETEVEDAATPDEIPADANNLVSKEELLNLIDSGRLTVDQMRQLAKELKFFGNGSVKYPQSFADYLVKNSLTNDALLEFLSRK